MRAWLAVALMTTGCDQVFGLDRGLPDAPPPNACAGRTPAPMYCADFDEPTILVYTNNLPAAFPPPTSDTTATLRAPSKTAATALWIDAHSGAAFGNFVVPSPMVSRLQATLWIKIEHPSAVSTGTGLIRLALSDTVTCFTNLEVLGDMSLAIHGVCPNENRMVIASPVPDGWLRVELTLDRTLGAATVRLEDRDPSTVTFAGAPSNVSSSIQLGLDVGGNNGLSVGYDDLTVVGD